MRTAGFLTREALGLAGRKLFLRCRPPMQEMNRQPIPATAVTPTPPPPDSAALSCWPEERILEEMLHPSELVRVMAPELFHGIVQPECGGDAAGDRVAEAV